MKAWDLYPPNEEQEELAEQMLEDLENGVFYDKQERAEFWMGLDQEHKNMMTKIEQRQADKDINDALSYLVKAPLIEHPQSPMAIKIIKQYKIFRLLESDKCVQSEMATEFEAYGYLMCLSLTGPASSEMSNLAEHLFRKYFPEDAEKIGVPETTHNKTLGHNEQRALTKLRGWLYKKQVQHIKEQKKIFDNQKAGEIVNTAPKKAQFTMEDFT